MNAFVNDHANTESSALALLAKRGWTIKILPAAYEDIDAGFGDYHATKDGTTIIAGDPLRLLGLSELHEHHHPHDGKPYWWAIESSLNSELEDQSMEEAFFIFKDENPSTWKKYLQELVAEFGSDRKTPNHEIIGISQKAYDRLVDEHPDLFKEKI